MESKRQFDGPTLIRRQDGKSRALLKPYFPADPHCPVEGHNGVHQEPRPPGLASGAQWNRGSRGSKPVNLAGQRTQIDVNGEGQPGRWLSPNLRPLAVSLTAPLLLVLLGRYRFCVEGRNLLSGLLHGDSNLAGRGVPGGVGAGHGDGIDSGRPIGVVVGS